ncbi:MAG: TonB-dependent receptor [Pseudomonadota bacterium]|nr:TonB-dependent receptor [Pseudomonadota bacterium]
MASNFFAKGLKRSALTVALGLCFAGGVQAQTNTAGAVTGAATSGDTITVSNPATGFSRTITVDGSGTYRFSQLPTGQYMVSRNGGSPRNVTVNVGTSTNVDFVTNDGTATLDTVTVVGTGAVNPIDVSSVESTTIMTSEQVAKIPVPRNVTSVALLAPGTVRGAANAGFGSLPSFGGSSVAENQYYVNGFNITNTFKNLAFAQIPFEGIAESQVKTGGYGAEFGRSTGGVINLITKRGTNEFHAGGNIFWEPEALQETSPDLFYNDGLRVSNNENDNGWAATAAIWASGALIKDRLFAYGLIQYGRTESQSFTSRFGTTNLESSSKRPQYLAKVDWAITDNHSLELTAFSDKREFEDGYFTAVFPNLASGDPTTTNGAFRGTDFNESGGDSYVVKYTGYLTDNFTLSALYGHGEFSRSNYGVSAAGVVQEYTGNLNGPVAGCPLIRDTRRGVSTGARPAIKGCEFLTFLGRRDALDTRDQFRIDAEWQLGDHLIRFGYDADKFESIDGTAYSGGALFSYQTTGPVTAPVERVRYRSFRSGANVGVEQQAFYIEDSWNVTDNFVAYLGLRSDSFQNKNGEGETYVDIKNQIAPRLGFSWDVFGDSTFKVFGNAGRYALPLTAGVATRAASASLFEEIYYSYTGVDAATGTPTGLTRIINPSTGSTATRFLNGEDGRPKYAAGYAVKNLDPMYQDEYILGFQKQLTDNFSLGVRGIHRDLKAAIDDGCDYATVIAEAARQGFGDHPGAQFNYCFLFNPGSDAVLVQDFDGDGDVEEVTIPGALLATKAKRYYSALEFFAQGNWDRFFLQGSYTFARAIGDTEGGVRSDNGQADTGTTSDFDYIATQIGAYGYGPNDRRHSLKMFGNYEFTDEWSMGANLLVQSGRPVSCIGIYKGFETSHYGNIHFSCDPGEPTVGANNGDTVVGRGTVGRTPWTQTLDLNVAYKPMWFKGLQFKADVFNVLNNAKPISVNEIGEDASGSPFNVRNTYGTPTAFQAPRSVRFLVQYDF